MSKEQIQEQVLENVSGGLDGGEDWMGYYCTKCQCYKKERDYVAAKDGCNTIFLCAKCGTKLQVRK